MNVRQQTIGPGRTTTAILMGLLAIAIACVTYGVWSFSALWDRYDVKFVLGLLVCSAFILVLILKCHSYEVDQEYFVIRHVFQLRKTRIRWSEVSEFYFSNAVAVFKGRNEQVLPALVIKLRSGKTHTLWDDTPRVQTQLCDLVDEVMLQTHSRSCHTT